MLCAAISFCQRSGHWKKRQNQTYLLIIQVFKVLLNRIFFYGQKARFSCVLVTFSRLFAAILPPAAREMILLVYDWLSLWQRPSTTCVARAQNSAWKGVCSACFLSKNSAILPPSLLRAVLCVNDIKQFYFVFSPVSTWIHKSHRNESLH